MLISIKIDFIYWSWAQTTTYQTNNNTLTTIVTGRHQRVALKPKFWEDSHHIYIYIYDFINEETKKHLLFKQRSI